MDLLSLLVVLIVFGVIFYIVNNLLPIAQPFKNIALAVVCVILLVWLLSLVDVGSFPVER